MNLARAEANAALAADAHREYCLARAEEISRRAAVLQLPGALYDPDDGSNIGESFETLDDSERDAMSAALRRNDCFALGALVIAHLQRWCAIAAEVKAEEDLTAEERAAA